jgi:predicted oxidoreductase
LAVWVLGLLVGKLNYQKQIKYCLIRHLYSRMQNILAAKATEIMRKRTFWCKIEGIENTFIGGIFLEHVILIITAKSH